MLRLQSDGEEREVDCPKGDLLDQNKGPLMRAFVSIKIFFFDQADDD